MGLQVADDKLTMEEPTTMKRGTSLMKAVIAILLTAILLLQDRIISLYQQHEANEAPFCRPNVSADDKSLLMCNHGNHTLFRRPVLMLPSYHDRVGKAL